MVLAGSCRVRFRVRLRTRIRARIRVTFRVGARVRVRPGRVITAKGERPKHLAVSG